MRADENLIFRKALACAVISLNSYIMEKANSISMYAAMEVEKTET